MATRAEHKAKAEELIDAVEKIQETYKAERLEAKFVDMLTGSIQIALQQAQVHATLATVPDAEDY